MFSRPGLRIPKHVHAIDTGGKLAEAKSNATRIGTFSSSEIFLGATSTNRSIIGIVNLPRYQAFADLVFLLPQRINPNDLILVREFA